MFDCCRGLQQELDNPPTAPAESSTDRCLMCGPNARDKAERSPFLFLQRAHQRLQFVIATICKLAVAFETESIAGVLQHLKSLSEASSMSSSLFLRMAASGFNKREARAINEIGFTTCMRLFTVTGM